MDFTITAVRGDTIVKDIELTRADDEGVDVPVSLQGATVKFTVKRRFTDTAQMFQLLSPTDIELEPDGKTGTARVTIPPDRTAGFGAPSSFVCDVEFTEDGGRVTTRRGTLSLEPDVTPA